MARKKKRYSTEPMRKEITELSVHIPILILRKSVGKLIEFINLHQHQDVARQFIIDQKYRLTKCRPEILNILTSISVRIEDMQQTWGFDDNVIAFDDKATIRASGLLSTRFRCYTHGGDKNLENYTSIDGKKIFTNHEAILLRDILRSIIFMQENKKSIIENIQEEKQVAEILSRYEPRPFNEVNNGKARATRNSKSSS